MLMLYFDRLGKKGASDTGSGRRLIVMVFPLGGKIGFCTVGVGKEGFAQV